MGCVRIWFISSAVSFSFFVSIALDTLTMPMSCRRAPVASWISRWLVNLSTVPMIVERMVTLITPAAILRSILPPIRMSWIISFLPSFTLSRSRFTVASTFARSISSPAATAFAMCSYSSMARR